MTNSSRKIICFITMVTLALDAGAASLDGTKWRVKVGPNKEAAAKGEREFDDELVFAEGKLTSTACAPYGYKASSYTIKNVPGAIKWTCEMVGAKEGMGKTTWAGRVKDNAIDGNMTWHKADGTVLHYTFSGGKVILDDSRTR